MPTADDAAPAEAQAIWAEQGELRAGAAAWFTRAMVDLARAGDSFYSKIRREQSADLPRIQVGEPESDHLSPLFKPIKVAYEWIVSVDEVLEFRVESFLAALYDLSMDHARQVTVGMFEHIEAVTEASGQVINASGRNFYDVVPELIANLDIMFDENGKHNTFIAIHPDTARKLAELTATPEQETRIREAWDCKRRQWDASRRRRDLPRVTD